VFEKKQLERFSRRDRDILLDVLKKGVSQLTRLRHPKILSILHPLEDSRLFTMFFALASLDCKNFGAYWMDILNFIPKPLLHCITLYCLSWLSVISLFRESFFCALICVTGSW